MQQYRGQELAPLFANPYKGGRRSLPTDPVARTRMCGDCRQVKSFDDFFKATRSKHGVASICKLCKRDRLRQWASKVDAHGLTREDHHRFLIQQSGRCSICSEPLSPKYVIDHDHACCSLETKKTGRTCGKCVRGLICQRCNIGLGMFKDDADLFTQAAAYLAAYQVRRKKLG